MKKWKCTVLFMLVWSLLATFAFAQGTTTVTYTATDDVIANPERGFYRYIDSLSSSPNDWTADNLQAAVSWSNVIEEENMTLVYCLFYLDQYMDVDTIPTPFIEHIKNNLQVVQDSGRKCILRFAYTSDLTYTAGLSGGRNDADYGDNSVPDILETGNNTEPEVARIVKHINQLGEQVITPKRDAVATVHAGFIGLWGEWYYTSNFADNSAALWEISEANYADRCQLVGALLNAIPVDMQVAVRMVVHKQGIGTAAGVSSNTIDCTSLDLSRISFHNDAFLSTWGDSGTFLSDSEYPENSPTADYTASRAYLAQNTLNVAMGGEINDPFGSNPDRSCTRALSEFAEFNWTYINVLYYTPALQLWEQQECLDDIQDRLGYRFNMVQGTFPNSADANGSLSFQLQIDNVGFAAPISNYNVELVLLDGNGQEAIFWNLDENIKSWYGGETTLLNKTLPLSDWLPDGNYGLYLRVRNSNDAQTNLNARIQMANVGTWNESLGMNNLDHVISISSGGNPNPTVAPTQIPPPVIPTVIPTQTPPPTEPLAIKTTSLTTYNSLGSIDSGQTGSNLYDLDQTGGDDGWSRYIALTFFLMTLTGTLWVRFK